MLAKYYVTTEGTALARRSPPRVAERIAPEVSGRGRAQGGDASVRTS